MPLAALSAAPAAPMAVPTTTCTTLGRPGMSALPAPYPTLCTVSAGIGPNSSANAVISATPVGVASSLRSAMPRLGAPRRASSSITAGAGFGSSP